MIRYSTDPIPFRVAALEQRVEELTARLEALLAANAANAVSTDVNAAADRSAYMRDYMRQRRAAAKNKNSVSP